jgi:hypothetical protein
MQIKEYMSAHLKKEAAAAVGLFLAFSAIGHSFIDGAICMLGLAVLFALFMAQERIKSIFSKPGYRLR